MDYANDQNIILELNKKIWYRYGGSSKSPSKYIRWLVKPKDDTSIMYLSNNDGGFSDYCLNIGEAKDSSSYYLTIIKCSKASYLFKYSVPFTEPSGKRITDSPNIGVYNNDGTLFPNKNGAPYCIHYSDTLYISQWRYIDGYPNFKWKKISQKTEYYTQTSTKTKVQTSTSYITSSTVIPSVTSTLLTMVITSTPSQN